MPWSCNPDVEICSPLKALVFNLSYTSFKNGDAIFIPQDSELNFLTQGSGINILKNICTFM